MQNFLSKFRNKFHRDLKSTVTLGFSLILALMILMALIGQSRMTENNTRFERTLTEQDAKTVLISTMRDLARERTLLLITAVTLSDPFDRDEALTRFNDLASDFLALRAQFEAVGLNREELTQFSQIMDTVRRATASQAQVAELISSGQLQEAQRILVEKAIPAQNHVSNNYNKFLDMQTRKSRTSIDQAKQANQATYFVMSILVAVTLSLGCIVAIFVIRRIKLIENALFDEKELAEVTLHSIAEGVITTNEMGVITYINPVAEQLTGWNYDQAKDKPLTSVYNIIDENSRLSINHSTLLAQLDGPSVSPRNRVLIHQDGHECAINDSTAPIRNKEGKMMGAVVVFNDVSEARNLNKQLSWQANHDSLTSLANRLEFESTLSQLLQSAQQDNKEHVLLFMDLDQFKLINDTCGHIAGDELLRQLSRTLETKVRDSDTLARLGGDEFGILLESCPISHGLHIAETIRELIASFKFAWENKNFEIGVSIGVVPINAQSDTIIGIMGLADSACYKAKNEGRNQIQVIQSPEQLSSSRGQTQSLLSTTQALAENRFRLFRQRIVPTAANRNGHAHYEILIRMLGEQNDIIPPAAFIPAAERYNMMPKIDRWVVHNTFKWLATHPQPGENTTYSLNLSGQSLADERFLGYVIEQLDHFQISAGTIGFEITETSAIANLSKAARFISTLKGLGCVFSLDDFGSGLSSYSYLKNLHVDYLKIDGLFIKNMVKDKVDYAMVESINRIGHVMGIKTVAEFVETDEIYQMLGELGVDYAQGYAIHKPEALPEQSRLV